MRQRDLRLMAVVILNGEHKAIFTHHALRPEDGLRGAGSAAGKNDNRFVVGCQVYLSFAVIIAVEERGKVDLIGLRFTLDYHAAELSIELLRLVDGIGELLVVYCGLAVDDVHDPGYLTGEEVRVYGHACCAELLGREEHEHGLRAVREHISDSVATADAELCKGMSKAVHGAVELTPCVMLLSVYKRKTIRVHLSVSDKEVIKLVHFFSL